MTTRGPQEPGGAGDPGGVVTDAVTTRAYKEGSGGGFFFPAPLCPLASSHEATAAASVHLPHLPKRRQAGATAGNPTPSALGNRITAFLGKFSG